MLFKNRIFTGTFDSNFDIAHSYAGYPHVLYMHSVCCLCMYPSLQLAYSVSWLMLGLSFFL